MLTRNIFAIGLLACTRKSRGFVKPCVSKMPAWPVLRRSADLTTRRPSGWRSLNCGPPEMVATASHRSIPADGHPCLLHRSVLSRTCPSRRQTFTRKVAGPGHEALKKLSRIDPEP